MLFRLQQRFARHDVVLNMPAFVHFEEGTQQRHQLLLVAFVFQRRRVQLLVQQHAAENRRGRQLPDGANHRRWAKMVGTGSRAGAFSKRGFRFTAVRGCHGLRAKRYVR